MGRTSGIMFVRGKGVYTRIVFFFSHPRINDWYQKLHTHKITVLLRIMNHAFVEYTLQGTNISHLGNRNIIFKMPFWGDMLVPQFLCSIDDTVDSPTYQSNRLTVVKIIWKPRQWKPMNAWWAWWSLRYSWGRWFFQVDSCLEDIKQDLPSRELPYPPKMAFWRWFSSSQGGIC